MKLRTRLIVAFLLLSVVPLGAVTFYSYRSNVDAMQEVATREADLLAGELSQRMQLVTAQLSERIEHLMEMPEPVEQTAGKAPVPSTPAAAAPSPAPASSATPADSSQYHEDVAAALGEAAILLNSVQMQTGRGFSGGRGDGRGGSAGGGFGQRPGGQGAGARGAMPSRPPANATPAPGASTQPPPAADATGSRAGSSGAVGQTAGTTSSTAASTSAAGTGPGTWIGPANPAVPNPPAGAATNTGGGAGHPPRQPYQPFPPGPGTITLRLGGAAPAPPPGTPAGAPQADAGTQIDLTQIRRDLYREILPNGTQETLTPDERQRVAREVNQRMMGIVEGIKLSALEIQKKADQARLVEEAAKKKSPAAKTSSTSAAAPIAPANSAAAPAPSAPAMTTVTAGTKRTAALSGNHLDVQVMRNGEVVRHANAEINLPNLLMTVFTSMPREEGEVPFAVDKDGKLYTPSDDDRKKIESLGAVAKPNGPLGTTVLPSWIVVTTLEPSGSGLRFGIASPIGDSLASLRQTAGRNAGFGLLIIALALAGVAPLSSRLTRNLSTLTEGVKRIAHGDYRARVDVRAHDEVGALAAAFNQMAEDVEQHQRAAVEQERIRRELELGRQIQHDMQPHGALRLGLTEITGVSVSAREVGGDFFNYFELASGHIAMLVGDVSGKGVGAALLMANIQASLRTRLSLGQDLKAVAEEIDLDIEANSPGPLYATLFVGILDPATRKLRYVNAGHHPQFVLRRQGGLERMSSTGMPVGLLAGHGHNQVEIQLAEGDRLFFYTDGCVEAENETDDMFGAERLETVLNGLPPAATPQDVLAQVERAIEQFRGSRELFDDVTVMAVRVG